MSSKAPTYAEPQSLPKVNLEVALPEPDDSMDQDAEWCVVHVEDEWRRIRFHDYAKLFSVPGLYEKILYDILECTSPQVVTDLLARTMKEDGEEPRGLRILDLGAGNGMVGELLAEQGADLVVGLDLIEEAAEAAERDRPGVYDNYHVTDLTQITDGEQRQLSGYRFNCLTCVAALGFGDIPPQAFTAAYNMVAPNGWIAFNIKEEFLDDEDSAGFAGLVQSMIDDAAFDERCRHRYRHRIGTDREPIYYVALVGRKRADIS